MVRFHPVIVLVALACAREPAPPMHDSAAARASAEVRAPLPVPDSFRVAFATSRGDVVVEVTRSWSPLAADRFHQLVSEGFFDDSRFFRVLNGYIAQFGLSGDPARNERWRGNTLPDEPFTESNARGTLVFAANGPNTRSHQLFFNLSNNEGLDRLGFRPIGRVVEGLGAVDALFSSYGETPDPGMIANRGSKYLVNMFPELDYIRTARVLDWPR